MIPYFILLFVPLSLSAFSYRQDRKVLNRNFPILVFFFILFSLLALRGISTGIDLRNYFSIFNKSNGYSFASLFDFSLNEPGFGLLDQVFREFTNGNFQLYLSFCALVSLLPIALLYFRNASHPVLTIILFISIAPFALFFSGIRQAIAIGVGVASFYFVKNKRLILFLICVFVAFLFHRSSVILLLLYPIYHLHIGKRMALFFGLVTLGCLVFNKQIFSAIFPVFSQIMEKYEVVTMKETGAYSMVILFALFGIFSFIIPDDKLLHKDTIGLRNILLLAVLIQCFAPVHTLAMRMNYYFIIFIPLLLPKIIDSASDRNKKVASLSVYVMSIFFLAYYFYNALFGADFLQIYPYVPFWEAQ